MGLTATSERWDGEVVVLGGITHKVMTIGLDCKAVYFTCGVKALGGTSLFGGMLPKCGFMSVCLGRACSQGAKCIVCGLDHLGSFGVRSFRECALRMQSCGENFLGLFLFFLLSFIFFLFSL